MVQGPRSVFVVQAGGLKREREVHTTAVVENKLLKRGSVYSDRLIRIPVLWRDWNVTVLC